MRIFVVNIMRINMISRLNITIDKAVITEAKKYAKLHRRSLSGIIEDYLKSLISKEKKEFEPSPIVKSLWGSVKQLPESEEYKELLEEEIIKKHLR